MAQLQKQHESPENVNSIVGLVPQSPPINFSDTYSPEWLQGRTIVITGGASGFGEGFFRRWASHGANVIIGDITDDAGRALVDEVRKTTGNPNHHYVHCNVTNWQSQVDFFREAARLSTHGGIDAIVANAGVTDRNRRFLYPNIDAEEPREPDFRCLDVNLVGVMYTAHLAMHFLPKNPNSANVDPNSVPAANTRDRHLLLIGSLSSVCPLPGQIIYTVAKHGVMGLFRTMRIAATGVRVNVICPYFIDTPLLTTAGRVLLAGGATGQTEDVVEAGTRMMADSRIIGRGLAVGPKVRVNDKGEMVEDAASATGEQAVWEMYADDFESTDLFIKRVVAMTNRVQVIRGWTGWAKDLVSAFYGSFAGTHRSA